MNIQNFKKIKRNSGQAMMISFIYFLFISLAIISGLTSPTLRVFKASSDLYRSKQSFFLAESGIEDAYYRLKNVQSLDSIETITLNGNIATTSIEDSAYNEKTITALGDVNSRQRTNKLILIGGTGASFGYGLQSGLGGFIMGNATVTGNVYSNGTIVSTNTNAVITGSAFAAGGLIDDINIGTLADGGDAWAEVVNDSTVAGNLYCQSGSGNNKPCDTSNGNPPVVDMPITEEMIEQWKIDAAEEEHVGDLTISSPTSIGPLKITGNLIINANLVIDNTVYVEGTISTSNNIHVSLNPSYGPNGGIIITDKPVNLSNNVVFEGSGTAGSYLMLITTSACPTAGCTSTNALEIANNVGAVILNAQNGTAHINNGVDLNELVANKIIMDNNASVVYDSGLANTTFTSGPQGGWNVYTWSEIE